MAMPQQTLDAFLAAFANHLRERGLPCRWVLPDVNGDILFSIAMKDGDVLLRWLSSANTAPPADAVILMDRPLLPPDNLPEKIGRALAERLAGIFMEFENQIRPFLDRRNRNENHIPYSTDGVLSFAADLMAPEKTAWGGYALKEWEDRQEDGYTRFVFTFSDGHNFVTAAFLPDFNDSLCDRAFALTPLGVLVILSDTRSEEDRELAAHQIERLLAFKFISGIHEGMNWTDSPPMQKEDPDTSSERQTRLQDQLSESRDLWLGHGDRFFQRWGNDDWFYLTMLYSPGADYVCHGGRECPGGSPPFLDPTDRLVPTPYRLPFPLEKVSRASLSGVDDTSTVFGGEDLLKDMLADRAEDTDAFTFVTSHCEYAYIGDRVRPICKNHILAERSNLQYVQTPMPQFLQDSHSLNWWKTLVDRIPDPNPDRKTPTVNLVGLAAFTDPINDHLRMLLEAVGVEVITSFYPLFKPDEFADFSKATLSIMRPWTPVRHIIGSLLDARGFRLLELPAPYGENATRLWLDGICEELDIPRLSDDAWLRLLNNHAPRLPRLREQMKEIPLGFVIRGAMLEELFDPGLFFGLDMPGLLADIGAPVRLFVLSDGRNDFKHVEAELYKRLPTARMVVADTFDALMETVANSDVSAIYSDINKNHYLSNTGKAPFGILDLSMGLSGFEQTLQRLIAIGRVDFYRRYRKWLTPAGGASNG